MRLYFDGGCKPNPGAAEIAVAIPGDPPEFFHQYIGPGTNVIAEWSALLYAMGLALDRGVRDIELIGDSKLVVEQATGQWKVKDENCRAFKAQFDALRCWFASVVVTHVPRADNLAGHHIESRERLRT